MKEIKTFSDKTEYYFDRKLYREEGPTGMLYSQEQYSNELEKLKINK